MVGDMAKTDVEAQRRLRQKWGEALMDAGYTVIPNAFLEFQHKLGLDAVDIAIIAHLVKHWWRADEPPYPSKKRIANALRLDPRTIQRRIAALEKRGLVRRETRMDATRGQRTNEYVLTGLIDMARPLAEQAIKDRQETQERRKARRKAGVRLALVEDDDDEAA